VPREIGSVSTISYQRTIRQAVTGLAAIAVGVMATSVSARAATEVASASITPSLSPARPGAKAVLTVTIRYSGGEYGVPPAVRGWALRLPAGMTLYIPQLRSCNARRLRFYGGRGCPAQSKIATGHALAVVHTGSQALFEHVNLDAFLGPPQGWEPTFEVLSQGYTPLDERVVLTGRVVPDSPPYGERLVMSIPPIPTLPLEPDASIISFSLTVGSVSRGSKKVANSILVPAKCPLSGFPFAGEFTYADGSTGTTQATVACPHRTSTVNHRQGTR
jgi:hypothetical protein